MDIFVLPEPADSDFTGAARYSEYNHAPSCVKEMAGRDDLQSGDSKPEAIQNNGI